VLGVFGTVIASDPSFAVDARTVDQVDPPLVDSSMATFAETLPPFVHVTVWEELPAQLTAVFGAETEKAPATNATVMLELVKDPPPARLSRTVQRKVLVVALVGSVSQAMVPGPGFATFPNVRERFVDGAFGRKRHALPEL